MAEKSKRKREKTHDFTTIVGIIQRYIITAANTYTHVTRVFILLFISFFFFSKLYWAIGRYRTVPIILFPRRFGWRIRRALNSVHCAQFNGREMYILGKRLWWLRKNYAVYDGNWRFSHWPKILLSASAAVVAVRACGLLRHGVRFIREYDTSINGFQYLPVYHAVARPPAQSHR